VQFTVVGIIIANFIANVVEYELMSQVFFWIELYANIAEYELMSKVVLQCVALCGSMLQYVATTMLLNMSKCRRFFCLIECCANIAEYQLIGCVALCCSVLQYVATTMLLNMSSCRGFFFLINFFANIAEFGLRLCCSVLQRQRC